MRCPFCGEEILAIARKCKHCGEFLEGNAKTASPIPSTSLAVPSTWQPGVAAVLNLFVPGAGYIYMGHVAHGVLLLVALPFLVVFSVFCSGAILAIPVGNADDPSPTGYLFLAVVLWNGLLFVAWVSTMFVEPFRIKKREGRAG